jgi:hypothetical protein
VAPAGPRHSQMTVTGIGRIKLERREVQYNQVQELGAGLGL